MGKEGKTKKPVCRSPLLYFQRTAELLKSTNVTIVVLLVPEMQEAQKSACADLLKGLSFSESALFQSIILPVNCVLIMVL